MAAERSDEKRSEPSPGRRARDRDTGRAERERDRDRDRGGNKDRDNRRSSRDESPRDRILRENQAKLAALKSQHNEGLERARALIAKFQVIARLVTKALLFQSMIIVSPAQPGGGSTREQRALKYQYDVKRDKWVEERCTVHMQPRPVAEVIFQLFTLPPPRLMH